MTVLAGTRRRPLLGAVGAAAVALLTVSGCSAGQDAQTVEQTSVVDGTAFQAGAVALRDVGLRAPSGTSYSEGATAYLEGFVVNQNATADQLVSVSTPIASSVEFFTDGVTALLGTQPSSGTSSSASSSASAGASATPTTTASAAPTDSTSATASPTDTTSAGATASGSTTAGSSSPAAAPTPLQTVTLPSNQSIQFGYGNQQLQIVLRGLTRQLFPAETFPVTFTFANGGSVTATIAVKLPVDSTIQAPTVNTEEQEGGE